MVPIKIGNQALASSATKEVMQLVIVVDGLWEALSKGIVLSLMTMLVVRLVNYQVE